MKNLEIDEDLRDMNPDEMRRVLMLQRIKIRAAGKEFENESCWFSFVVIASLCLPLSERNKFLNNFITMSKNNFMKNCSAWYDEIVTQGKAPEVIMNEK